MCCLNKKNIKSKYGKIGYYVKLVEWKYLCVYMYIIYRFRKYEIQLYTGLKTLIEK